MEQFIGKFKLVSSENFDEYLKKIGVGMVMRAAANAAKPDIEISQAADEKVTIKTISTVKNTVLTFTLGQEFDETTADGRNVKSTVTLEDGKMVHRQKATKSGEKDSEIVRSVEGDQLIVVVSCEDVKSKRVYKKE